MSSSSLNRCRVGAAGTAAAAITLVLSGFLPAAPATGYEQPTAPVTRLDTTTEDTALTAPPEPAAAASRTLPLVASGQASADELAVAVEPDPALDTVRDLATDAPALPASARSFSTEQAGSARTLVLYDTTGPYAHLGEYYALGMGLLASHSGTVTALPVADYTAGLAGAFTAVIYNGSTYDEPLPRAFIDDVLTGDVPVLWSGFNIWQLVATEEDRAAFATRYGWDAATSYIDSADRVTTVTYNGQDLTRNALNEGGILAPHITDPNAVTVLGDARCSDTAGTAVACSTVAQTTGSTYPWAVRSGNLTYIGEVPLSYISETDRYLAAADIVLDTLDPTAQTIRQAAVRIEDVSPDVSGEELRTLVDYLVGADVPFQIAVVPVYTDPNGVYNDGVPVTSTLADNPELVATLQYATQHGGTLIQHGTTHQFGAQANPYNGVSSDDFEFIRSWCTQTNTTSDPAVSCTNDTWVQIGGDLFGTGATWAAQRVWLGRASFAQAGLEIPTVFETPHYAATASAYAGINTVYSVRYERELLHAGLLTGQAGGAHDYYGQFFPYAVNDPYGTHILPENLGNVELESYNQHPPRLPADIVDNARINLVGTHATASFFFHPYLDVSMLQQIVEGIRAQGYTFVPATELT
ncbi:polysaccharide deacetylase family protein [Actinomyces sp. MRS3W]|uniref:polysaccharide deacetylase family protein n=1 Tax=Actinomyces sp. MRS3W TaxID=2800796 RepID=UPI0028FD6A05|nr:polysaccharide deacetylase family protein [Actinomyces sp. MRS3W]MDU0348524.1 polysaccharide deacetylase family protein [Actinomyces sp. MRS3W]